MTVLVLIQDFISLDYGRQFMLGYQICIQQSYRPLLFWYKKFQFEICHTSPDNLPLYHDIVQYPIIITYDFTSYLIWKFTKFSLRFETTEELQCIFKKGWRSLFVGWQNLGQVVIYIGFFGVQRMDQWRREENFVEK